MRDGGAGPEGKFGESVGCGLVQAGKVVASSLQELHLELSLDYGIEELVDGGFQFRVVNATAPCELGTIVRLWRLDYGVKLSYLGFDLFRLTET